MRILNYIFMAYAQQVLDAIDTRPRSPAQLLPDFMASAASDAASAAACVAAFCEGCFYITASLCAVRDRPLIHHCPTPSNELLMYRQWTDDSPLPRGAYKLPLPLLSSPLFSFSLSPHSLSRSLSLLFFSSACVPFCFSFWDLAFIFGCVSHFRHGHKNAFYAKRILAFLSLAHTT